MGSRCVSDPNTEIHRRIYRVYGPGCAGGGRMRADLKIIQQWVQPGHHVLDLGCGDGTLLHFLQQERSATGFGLEINPDHITTCMGKGVAVIEQNLDTQGLENFDDGMFDIVLMTQALQAVRRPDKVIEEMLRVGREGIVTFPNFAHWRLRWRSEEHTSELQSRPHLVCRLLLEKKKTKVRDKSQ